jgi:hypothetical protein
VKNHAPGRHGERARNTPIGVAGPDVYAGLERIKHLEAEFGRTGVRSRRHRELAAAIRIEAVAYRKSLDSDQAAAIHDSRPRIVVGSGLPIRTVSPEKPASVRPSATARRAR